KEAATAMPMKKLHHDLTAVESFITDRIPTTNAAIPTIVNNAQTFLLALLLGLIFECLGF
ncbi:MAG: hypothetical protein K2J46_02790, partial [Muribaculaceae bacterium]|nr:hypothetical protein [Muribaculaceae bacterium]